MNNEATRGGLKNQVADINERCTQGIHVTITEMLWRWDALVSTDVGPDTYEKNKGKRPWGSRNQQESSGSGNGSGNGDISRKDRRILQAHTNGNGKTSKTPKTTKWVRRTCRQDTLDSICPS